MLNHRELNMDGRVSKKKKKKGVCVRSALGGVTLMDKLVEGVLSVGPGLAPHDRSGLVVHTGAIFGDVLPVRLHVALTTTETAPLFLGGKLDPFI